MALLFAIIAMLLISWLQLHTVRLCRSLSLPGASDSIRDTGRPPYSEATAKAPTVAPRPGIVSIVVAFFVGGGGLS